MKVIKKNQIIIYTIALMLVVAGYLNFKTNGDLSSAVKTSSSEEELIASNVGDAELVSSKAYTNNETQNVESSENIVENTVETNSKVESENERYFSESKLERDSMYSQMIESYEKILNSGNSLETQKQSAQDEIAKINETKNSIMICENLIKTKGFKNVVIFVNNNSISVIVEDEQLNSDKVAQIQNIICREMSTKAENIHISSK